MRLTLAYIRKPNTIGKPKKPLVWCCELTLTHDIIQGWRVFSAHAFFSGAQMCNEILAVSYDLYICANLSQISYF